MALGWLWTAYTMRVMKKVVRPSAPDFDAEAVAEPLLECGGKRSATPLWIVWVGWKAVPERI